MIGETITCENDGCDVVFVKKTHNQRYHDNECTRLATNAKIMVKYHQRRAQKLGYVRYCEQCEAKLSKYNSEPTCNSCMLKSQTERNNTVVNMLASIAWA